jgi:hypothetical protein
MDSCSFTFIQQIMHNLDPVNIFMVSFVLDLSLFRAVHIAYNQRNPVGLNNGKFTVCHRPNLFHTHSWVWNCVILRLFSYHTIHPCMCLLSRDHQRPRLHAWKWRNSGDDHCKVLFSTFEVIFCKY